MALLHCCMCWGLRGGEALKQSGRQAGDWMRQQVDKRTQKRMHQQFHDMQHRHHRKQATALKNNQLTMRPKGIATGGITGLSWLTFTWTGPFAFLTASLTAAVP